MPGILQHTLDDNTKVTLKVYLCTARLSMGLSVRHKPHEVPASMGYCTASASPHTRLRAELTARLTANLTARHWQPAAGLRGAAQWSLQACLRPPAQAVNG